MIGGFCLKAWSRLQQAVALSSAESELYGLVEGAKAAPSRMFLGGRIFQNLTSRFRGCYCNKPGGWSEEGEAHRPAGMLHPRPAQAKADLHVWRAW